MTACALLRRVALAGGIAALAGAVTASEVPGQPVPRACEASFVRADPNPVPVSRETGTTTISWGSPTGCGTGVYVTAGDGEWRLFGGGPRGVLEAPWIVRGGGPYRFVLAAGDPDKAPLAEVIVTSSAASDEPWLSFAVPSARWSMLWPVLAFAGLVAAAAVAARRRGHLPRGLLTAGAVVAIALAVVPVLRAEPRALADQPFPDAQEYADSARQLARGNGYVTEVYVPPEDVQRRPPPEGTLRPPRYPPGYSVALASSALVGTYPWNVQRGAKLLVAFYVIVAALAAWSLGGPLAAGIAASLMAAAPFATTYGSLVLSDAFSAALLIIAVAAAGRATMAWTAIAGAAAAAAAMVRLALLFVVPLLLFALPARRRLLALTCAVPLFAGLAASQWRSYGSPFETGYSYWFPDLTLFGLSNATSAPPRGDGPWIVSDVLHGDLFRWACPCTIGGPQAELPNLLFYPAVLLGLFWIFAPPLTTVPGLVYAWLHRAEPAAGLTLWITAAMLVCFIFFFSQGARFMAGPATLLVVWTAVAASHGLEGRLAKLTPDVGVRPPSPTVVSGSP